MFMLMDSSLSWQGNAVMAMKCFPDKETLSWQEMLYGKKGFHTNKMLLWHETLSWQGDSFMAKKCFLAKTLSWQEMCYGMKCFMT